MSLLLLDYLFDRDTQAVCNVSGSGKLGKRRLDPLLMYGIQCKASLYLAASCCLLRYCLNAVKQILLAGCTIQAVAKIL